MLAEQRFLSTVITEKALTAYLLSEDGILVGAPDLADLRAGRHLLVCGVCRTQITARGLPASSELLRAFCYGWRRQRVDDGPTATRS
ncbi:hypothetical protein [Nocardia abscessus]|uniref:hypothetical protein n=1 Tax=Nocardia abscessus TaxID=120957 RepID=UPI002455BEC1|nr:hypothetical protein [Nocardia abscessus]